MLNFDSKKFQSKCFEIALWNGCSPANLQHIFRTHFPKNNYGGLLLILSTKLFLQRERLSDTRVASITKNKYVFTVHGL